MPFLLRLLREPLVAFLLIGGGLFGLYAAVQPAAPERATAEIVVTPAIAAQLAVQYRAIWRRPPSQAEMEGLIAKHVRDEVLLREAASLSLGQGDPIVRQRMVQKMTFLLESVAGASLPSEDDLRGYFAEHAADYRTPARIGFEQVFLGEDVGAAEIEAALDALRGGADPAGMGVRSLMPVSMPASALQAVDGSFGAGVFAQLERLPGEGWHGPVTSGFGVHLVRITGRELPTDPPFEAVRASVERDWRADNANALAEAQYERLRAGYEIRTPSPEDLADILR